ncbi:MAG TPA: pirin family protein [Rudaea sp.]
MNQEFLRLEGHVHDLGGFTVRRVLPQLAARRVGPFVFFDHLGPARFDSGNGIDVRPHPHIGLATVTYLFDGALRHRDSLGSVQDIRPGDVNWMTAGRGIVHSERTPPEERERGHAMHGIQTWVALPLDAEETEPSFEHHPAATLPEFVRDGVKLRLIAGEAFGQRAPTRVFSPTFYLAAHFPAGARLVLPPEHAERAVYAVDAGLLVDGRALAPGEMAVLAAGGDVAIDAPSGGLAMLCGGASLDGDRHMNWNFVSSSRERIERARQDWANDRFGRVPGETEFIPLPDR